MSRIPVHTLASVPLKSRSMLEALSRRSLACGRPLNLHAQMAHSPAVLAAYGGFRDALEQHGIFTPKIRAAVMLTVCGAASCAYTESLNIVLAKRAGWTDAQIAEIRAGQLAAESSMTALLRVAREAGTHGGHVDGATWTAALEAGWTDAELAEAFACISLAGYVSSFVAYAGTPVDVPVTA